MPKSTHHSFDIQVAEEYGIAEAIIIHHMQHWVNHNQKMNRNFIEGRTWTYQTREEMSAWFPYLSTDQVRRLTDKLVEKGVLVKGNFNKHKMDKTIWYAFKTEEEFTIGKSAKWTGESANRAGESAKAIPDTKPDTKPDREEKKKSRDSVPPSIAPEALRLSSLFYQKILANDDKAREPNLERWAKELDKIHRLDGRSWEDIERLIVFAQEDEFWRANCLSPTKLRAKATTLVMQMAKQPSKQETDASKHGDNMGLAQDRWSTVPDKFLKIGIPGVAVNVHGEWQKIRYTENGFYEQVTNALRKSGYAG